MVMRKALLGLLCLLFLVPVAARADVVPPQPAPIHAVIAFAENFNAGSVEGLDSVLSKDPGFEWRDGDAPPRDRASFLEGSGKAFAEGRGLRMEFVGEPSIQILEPGRAVAVAQVSRFSRGEDGQEKPDDQGVLILSLKLEADGLWRITSFGWAAQ
ncbi:MAG: hypothetical protein HXY22_09230 [Alphaproteobacteria bacterium]|nr:hypothetical protein [Alphaproteobacteria bacterium]